jgi:hypothetical protein
MTMDTLDTLPWAESSPDGPVPPRRPPVRWGRLAAFGAVIAFVAVVATLAVVAVVDDDEAAAPSSTTVTTAATTSTPPGASTTVTPTTVVDTSTAVWPFAATSVRYTDPRAAAQGFAVDFLGFESPAVGPFMAGDSRSGEVEIRPTADGPVTTIFVRQLGAGDEWWVLGAATANIRLDEPAALSTVTSPVQLQGTSTAFEANVSVEVRQDGSITPIGRGSVMGGSMGEMGPFDGSVEFDGPTTESGAIVLATQSMEDGATWEAAVVRVHFDN